MNRLVLMRKSGIQVLTRQAPVVSEQWLLLIPLSMLSVSVLIVSLKVGKS
jgi:hypothetical protein